jgi:hypothetical protein
MQFKYFCYTENNKYSYIYQKQREVIPDYYMYNGFQNSTCFIFFFMAYFIY